MADQKPSVGRIVHYTLPSGEIRPAVVVQDWKTEEGCVNLQVFLDGTNDLREGNQLVNTECEQGLHWATSVTRKDEPTPGYWHWPKRD